MPWHRIASAARTTIPHRHDTRGLGVVQAPSLLTTMATPTFFPEGNTPHGGDNITRSLIKVNGRLYDLAMATLSWLGPVEAACAPHAWDNPQRSLLKINALLNALGGGSGSVNYGGNGDPNGVITANQNDLYAQWDAPGVIWVKLTAGGNTGWASNS